MIRRHAEHFRGIVYESSRLCGRINGGKGHNLMWVRCDTSLLEKVEQRWRSVLKRYRAPYFHFREFADKNNKWKISGNPFLSWEDSKRDSFINDLAIVLCEEAVPVGSTVNMSEVRNQGVEPLSYDFLIGKFYLNVRDSINAHWPGFDGDVLFVFDETDKPEWISTLRSYHQAANKADKCFGGLAFEDDRRCPPLQAADLFAYAMRQNSEKYYANDRTKQAKRTLDWILSRNMGPMFKKEFTYAGWLKLVRLVLADRKRKRALWAKSGQPKRVYFPEIDFEPEKHGGTYRRVDADYV